MSHYENFQLKNYGDVLPATYENESQELELTTKSHDYLSDRQRVHYECLDLLHNIEIQRRLIAQDEAVLKRYDALAWHERDITFGLIATKQLARKMAKVTELEKQYNLLLTAVSCGRPGAN